MTKRHKRALTIATLTGAALSAVVAFWPRERLLLDRATPVVRRNDWNRAVFSHWLSNDELLIRRRSAEELGFVDNRSYSLLYPVVRRNIRTGRETPLTGFEALAHRESLISVLPSPDGKRLLCERSATTYAGDDPQKATGYFVCDLNGAHVVRWPERVADQGEWTRAVWCTDSRHWIEQYAVNHAGKYNTTNPPPHEAIVTKTHDVNAPGTDELIRSAPSHPLFALLDDGSLAVQTTTDAVISDCERFSETDGAQCHVWQADLHSAAPPRRHALVLPLHSTVHLLACSPKGSRIALVLERQRERNVFDRFLGRWFPSLNAHPEKRQELWTANVDGSGLREIGGVVQPYNPPPTLNGNSIIFDPYIPPDTEITQLQWLPDGGRLSFVCKGALWMVAAE